MNYLKNELYDLIKTDDSVFDFIQDSVLDGLWYWDIEHPEEEWMNPKFWRLLGYDPNEMPHKSAAWQHIIHPEDLQRALENFELHCADPKHPYDQDVRYTHKLGHTVWVRCRGKAIRDAGGKPIRMIGAHTDITALKNAEENAKKNAEQYRNILEGSDIGTWMWNVQTNETFFNEKWANIIGYTLEELMPISLDTWTKNTHPDDLENSFRLVQQHFDGKPPFYECEIRMLHRSGQWVWILDKGKVCTWTAEGKPLIMSGSHQEITARKENEEKLRKSEEHLRMVLRGSNLGVWDWELATGKLEVNDLWKTMLGLSPETEVDIDVWNARIHPDDMHKLEYLFKNAILNPEGKEFSTELRAKHSDGHYIWIHDAGAVVQRAPDGSPMRVSGTHKDITEKMKLQAEMEATQNKLKSILDEMTDMVFSVRLPDFKALFVSPAAEKIYGLPQKDFQNDSSNWQKFIHPEDRDVIPEIFENLKKHGVSEKEYRIIDGNGELKWVSDKSKMVKDAAGIPVRIDGNVSDISEKKKKEAELKVLLHLTEDQNKRLKNFTYIVSHNIRSHSANIDGLVQVLRDERPELAGYDIIDMLAEAATNLETTLRHLNEVVTMDSVKDLLGSWNLRHFAEKAIVGLATQSKNVHIENHIPPELTVIGIPAYLSSIILNFLTNGIRYRSENRESFIRLSAHLEKDFVVLCVEDNGLGIDLEKHGAKLFGMYKTFHSHKDSRGLGLFLSNNQIEAMGGKIEVQSTVGLGTVFKIFFKHG